MPEAHPAYAAPTARVPRVLFQHAHEDGSSLFPPNTVLGNGEMFIEIPNNWNGTDSVYIWLLPLEASANTPFDIIGHAGTHGEAFNIHTQTVNGTILNLVANQYYRWDVTAVLNTLIPLIAANDMCWFTVDEQFGVSCLVIGVEIRET